MSPTIWLILFSIIGVLLSAALIILALRLGNLRSRAEEWDQERERAFQQAAQVQEQASQLAATLAERYGAYKEPYTGRTKRANALVERAQAECERVFQDKDRPPAVQLSESPTWGAFLVYPLYQELRLRERWLAATQPILKAAQVAHSSLEEARKVEASLAEMGRRKQQELRALLARAEELRAGLSAETRPSVHFESEQFRLAQLIPALESILTDFLEGEAPAAQDVVSAHTRQAEIEPELRALSEAHQKVVAQRQQAERKASEAGESLKALLSAWEAEESAGRSLPELKTRLQSFELRASRFEAALRTGDYEQVIQEGSELKAQVEEQQAQLKQVIAGRLRFLNALNSAGQSLRELSSQKSALPPIYDLDVTGPLLANSAARLPEMERLSRSENLEELRQARLVDPAEVARSWQAFTEQRKTFETLYPQVSGQIEPVQASIQTTLESLRGRHARYLSGLDLQSLATDREILLNEWRAVREAMGLPVERRGMSKPMEKAPGAEKPAPSPSGRPAFPNQTGVSQNPTSKQPGNGTSSHSETPLPGRNIPLPPSQVRLSSDPRAVARPFRQPQTPLPKAVEPETEETVQTAEPVFEPATGSAIKGLAELGSGAVRESQLPQLVARLQAIQQASERARRACEQGGQLFARLQAERAQAAAALQATEFTASADRLRQIANECDGELAASIQTRLAEAEGLSKELGSPGTDYAELSRRVAQQRARMEQLDKRYQDQLSRAFGQLRKLGENLLNLHGELVSIRESAGLPFRGFVEAPIADIEAWLDQAEKLPEGSLRAVVETNQIGESLRAAVRQEREVVLQQRKALDRALGNAHDALTAARAALGEAEQVTREARWSNPALSQNQLWQARESLRKAEKEYEKLTRAPGEYDLDQGLAALEQGVTVQAAAALHNAEEVLERIAVQEQEIEQLRQELDAAVRQVSQSLGAVTDLRARSDWLAIHRDLSGLDQQVEAAATYDDARRLLSRNLQRVYGFLEQLEKLVQ